MKITINNLKGKITTDNPKLLKSLIDYYSYYVDGYNYTPQYRNGAWDGKSSFITSKGTFPAGLLHSILNTLKEIECTPTIGREGPAIPDVSYNSLSNIDGFTLYDYQEELVKLALKTKRAIIKSPTGSGKTLILASLIATINEQIPNAKMVILFNSKQILTQTYQFLTEECGFDNIGICFGEGYVYNNVMLTSVKSIEKILDTHLDEAVALFADEAHEFSTGKLSLAAVSSFPNAAYRFGLTATPPTKFAKKFSLEGAFGPVAEVVNTQDLTASGVLTKASIQLLDLPEPKESTSNMSYLEVYDKYIVNNLERNTIISKLCSSITKKNPNARILILTKQLEHGVNLQKLLGNNAFYLEGKDDISTRYETINKFRSYKGSSILIGTNILQTGVNIKEITHFINARGLKSEIATLQALGRALRIHESKNKVFIYDFLDKGKYIDSHAKKRAKFYKDEGHTIKIIDYGKNS